MSEISKPPPPPLPIYRTSFVDGPLPPPTRMSAFFSKLIFFTVKPVPLFTFQILNTWLLSLWNMPPNPRYMRNLNISVLQDAPLHIWKLPSAVILRESLSGHRAVFLKSLYTATDAEDITAADKMFEKKIDVSILEMLHFPRSVTGLYIRRRKAAELMVEHRSRNLKYIAALQSFGASPTMKTLVGVRSALIKDLHALKNIYLI